MYLTIENRAFGITGPSVPASLVPASFPLGNRWFVVYTNIKCEMRAKLGLQAKGFSVFLPVVTKNISHARKITLVARALFPRYLFVSFDIERDEWFHPIKSTDGVEELLRNNQIPVRVPTTEIESLQEMQLRGDFDLRPQVEARFTLDEIVKISEGAFRGFNGRVLALMPAQHRAKLAVTMFGGQADAVIDWDKLEKL